MPPKVAVICIEIVLNSYKQVQFNTDLLEHEAHNLYKNGRLDAKVFKEINETEYLKIKHITTNLKAGKSNCKFWN